MAILLAGLCLSLKAEDLILDFTADSTKLLVPGTDSDEKALAELVINRKTEKAKVPDRDHMLIAVLSHLIMVNVIISILICQDFPQLLVLCSGLVPFWSADFSTSQIFRIE